MENLIFSLNATIPIFLMMLAGLLFRKMGLFNDNFVEKMNQFVFKAALPVLLFQDLSQEDFATAWDGSFVGFCFLATTGCILLSVALSFFMKKESCRENSSRRLTGAAPRFWESPLSRIYTEIQEWPR